MKTVQIILAILLIALPGISLAHFQTLIPGDEIISEGDPAKVQLEMIFTHPMDQGPVMEMGKPKSFGVMVGGAKKDLTAALKPKKIDGKTAYSAEYKVGQPGDHLFYLEPAPYWEPAEAKMIIHYTKVVVDAYGAEDGWSDLIGLPVEIEPLTRPYGLWAGNVFRGIVRADGQPVPWAEIEVEYYNTDGVRPPADPYVTQVIKADGNGVFCYGLARAGWWSFAALVDGPEKMTNPDGKKVGVELGGLLWVRCVDMK